MRYFLFQITLLRIVTLANEKADMVHYTSLTVSHKINPSHFTHAQTAMTPNSSLHLRPLMISSASHRRLRLRSERVNVSTDAQRGTVHTAPEVFSTIISMFIPSSNLEMPSEHLWDDFDFASQHAFVPLQILCNDRGTVLHCPS